MQNQKNNKQKILLLILVIVLIFALYFFFFRNNNIALPEVAFDEFGNPIETMVVGYDLINLLDQLQGVELNDSLFRTPAFQKLTDYSIELPSLPQGRSNPFSPI